MLPANARVATLLVLLAACSAAPAQTIRTYAGGGAPDGQAATQTELIGPTGLAVDGGAILIGSGGGGRVLRIGPDGLVTTVAGNGAVGYSGDGGPASRATLNFPRGVAVDTRGNVYIADSLNGRIRRRDADTGFLRTFAGGGFPAAGNGDGGPATGASLNEPWQLTFDARGNLYAGEGGHRVRRIDPNGIISTVAGTGEQGFSGDGGPATTARFYRPLGVAVASDGTLYVADSANFRIRRVDPATGVVTTIAGSGEQEPLGDGGPALQAGFSYPGDLLLSADERYLFVDDTFHSRLRRIDLVEKTITTVAGNGDYGSEGDGGPATLAAVTAPRGLARDAQGNLYVATEANFDARLRRIAPDGTITSVAGTLYAAGDGGPATAALLRAPQGPALDGAGNLLFADAEHLRVRKVDRGSGVISVAAGDGRFFDYDLVGDQKKPAAQTAVGIPADVFPDPAGGFYVVDAYGGFVYRVDASGLLERYAGGGENPNDLGDGGPASAARFDAPRGIALDARGNLLIADTFNHRIRKVDAATRVVTTIAGSGPTSFGGGAYAGDGGPATEARLSTPEAVRVDAAGNIYVSDTGNSRVRVITPDGRIERFAGGGDRPANSGDGGPAREAELFLPGGLAIDPGGNIFVAERGNHRVRRIDAVTKVISTVAGIGRFGFTGDRGAATAARLNEPRGVAVAPDGTLYIADTLNARIRIVPGEGGCPLPTIAVQPENPSVIAGLSAILDVEATGGALSYQWYEGLTGDTSRPVAGGASRTLTTRPLTSSTPFWVRVTNSCGSVDSETAYVAVATSLADLSAVKTSVSSVQVGGSVEWTVLVRNDGPSTATGIVLIDTMPDGVPATSATASQGSCSGTSSVSCAIGSLVPGATASVTIRGTVVAAGLVSNRARVTALEVDPNPGNNLATKDLQALPAGSADVYLDQGATPLPARQGQDLTLGFYLANNGPATITNVRVTDALPSSFTLVSASASQGACSGTTTVICDLVALDPTGAATITLVVRPTTTGIFRNQAAVTMNEPDPVPFNNTAALDIEVRSNQPDCPAATPGVVSSPEGVVRGGNAFSVTWSDVFGALDPNGAYRAVLASSSDFAPGTILSDSRTRSLTASFPTQPGTSASYYFRVSSIAGCGRESAPSAFVTVNVAPNPPALVVSAAQSPEWVTLPNGSLPAATVRFKNLGGSAAPVTFTARYGEGPGFFTFTPTAVNLAGGQEVEVQLTALPGATAQTGVKSAYLTARYGAAEVSASVTLAVTDVVAQGISATPDRDEILLIGRRAPSRHALVEAAQEVVSITNTGAVPIFLVPSVGPGGAWLVLDLRQFATPLPAGQTRQITLRTDPSRLTSADYPLPIWTVLTISTAGGDAARDRTQLKVFFTEAGAVVDGSGRGFLGAGETSFVIPTAVHRAGVGGTVFTSDGWIRNLSPDTASVDFYMTPSGQDGQLQAQKVTQTIPGFTTLRLYDFVMGLFGSDVLAGPVEVRSRDFGQLSVRATANGLPGSGEAASRYGTEIPVFGSGTGTGVGQPALVLTGIKSVPEGAATRGFRLNVILSETLGAPATVRLRLYDPEGTELASSEIAVPPLGNSQLPLLAALGLPDSTSVESGSLVIEGVSGTGRVVAIGTLIDNASGSFQSLSGRLDPSRLAISAAPAGAARGARRTPLAVPAARVIPSIVHSRGAQGTFFTTEVSITNATAQPAALRLTYDYAGSVSGQATADVTVPPRASLAVGKSRDAVVNLFGLPPDSNTAGPMRIEGAGVSRIVARATVTTPVDPQDAARGIKGSEFQSYSSVSPEAVSRAGTPVTTYPGMQVFDGIRTNLILAEVSGQAAQVRVRAINGTTGGVLGEMEVGLSPWERLQINNVFGAAGFAIGNAGFDRVSLSLEPAGSANGAVVGAVSVIDNVSASSRILVLAPPGPPGGSTIGF